MTPLSLLAHYVQRITGKSVTTVAIFVLIGSGTLQRSDPIAWSAVLLGLHAIQLTWLTPERMSCLAALMAAWFGVLLLNVPMNAIPIDTLFQFRA